MGIDGDCESKPLIDALLVIRYLCCFSGASLTSGAVSGDAGGDSSEAIAGYLTDADLELSSVRRQTLWNHLTLFLSDTFLPVTYPV